MNRKIELPEYCHPMTGSWTDLIETDPLGAYHAWKDLSPIQRGKDLTTATERRLEIRLMSNLAALCESLAKDMSDLSKALKDDAT